MLLLKSPKKDVCVCVCVCGKIFQDHFSEVFTSDMIWNLQHTFSKTVTSNAEAIKKFLNLEKICIIKVCWSLDIISILARKTQENSEVVFIYIFTCVVYTYTIWSLYTYGVYIYAIWYRKQHRRANDTTATLLGSYCSL